MKKHYHVVVGVLLDAEQQVLLALRGPDQDYGGLWEFPGGKCEAQEDVYAALLREWQEEIAIDITQATPWMIIDHEYELYFITLHVWRIQAYHGGPIGSLGNEGQELRWVPLNSLDQYQFPRGNQPILSALRQLLVG